MGGSIPKNDSPEYLLAALILIDSIKSQGKHGILKTYTIELTRSSAKYKGRWTSPRFTECYISFFTTSYRHRWIRSANRSTTASKLVHAQTGGNIEFPITIAHSLSSRALHNTYTKSQILPAPLTSLVSVTSPRLVNAD